MIIFVLFSFFCTLFLWIPVSLQCLTVVTPSGRINGKIIFRNGIPVREYLGIPFVKPPLGDFRFKRPVPVEPWNTTLEAKTLPPGCPQYSPTPGPTLDNPPGLSEDCLYLNIWAPATASKLNKKSVMFWIHTGGFSKSSSRLDVYNGQALASEGDVIVVTTNYRLGALGFFFSASEDAPGNMGMLDLVESLKWVRQNIESFGGDKDSITLFGHSAGGIAVGMFCVSPLTRGLFRRAILQSGSPTNLDAEDNDLSFVTSQELANAVNCSDNETTLESDPDTVVGCMRGVDAMELAIKLSEVTSKAKRHRSNYPRFGDEFLPRNPRLAIIDGEFDPVDVLVGSNDGDGSPLITSSMKDVFGVFGEKNPQINFTFGESIIRNKFKSYPDPDSVVRQYLGGVEEDDYYKIRFEVFTATGDYVRVCPSVYFTESFAKRNPNVYYYFYTHRPNNSPYAPWMLAVHFDETPFVFGYPLRYPQNYTQAERRLSRRMIKAWSSFAKTGNPEPGIWPRYSEENPIYQALDVNTLATGYGPHRENCDFFRSYFGF